MATSTSTIVFTDVVGSTAHACRVGEDAADRLFRSLERAVGEVVAAHAGARGRSTGGDGVMAAFDSATDAVQACVAVQQRVVERVRRRPAPRRRGRRRRQLGQR